MTKRRGANRKAQPAAQPEKKYDERAHVQARHDQNVIRGGFLKCGDDFGIHEAAVAEQHRPQHRRALGLAREKRVEPREQISARARQPLQKSWPRAVNQLQQFAAAQRAGQVDLLPREVAAQIERAGIEKIARRLRLHKRFDAVARAQALAVAASECDSPYRLARRPPLTGTISLAVRTSRDQSRNDVPTAAPSGLRASARASAAARLCRGGLRRSDA